MSVVTLFGIPIQVATMRDVLDRVDNAVATRNSLDIGVVNAAKIVNMRKDAELASAVLSSDVIYADGMSVVWASKILRRPLPERIAGIELMYAIMKQGQEKGYRVFCLGATQEVVDTVCEVFGRTYPKVMIAGSHHGYFDADDEAVIANMVREANADVLFVAMTSPKKEQFMSKWTGTMNVPIVHGVGGSFDIVAGKTKRAPEFLQKAGLEWLYRVLQEPRRLARRYFVTNALFLWLVTSEYVRQSRGSARTHQG